MYGGNFESMKAFIRGEIFSDDLKQKFRIAENIANYYAIGAGSAMFSWPSDTWAAEITGLNPKYKFERKFLKGKKDYTYSNGKGSRGIFFEWALESGHIYEIKRRISWGKIERFFCTVCENGDIIKLEEKDVIECLKHRSALMCLPQRKDVSLMCLTTSPVSMCHSAEEKTAQ